jgi:hypothetical protein
LFQSVETVTIGCFALVTDCNSLAVQNFAPMRYASQVLEVSRIKDLRFRAIYPPLNQDEEISPPLSALLYPVNMHVGSQITKATESGYKHFNFKGRNAEEFSQGRPVIQPTTCQPQNIAGQ